LTESLGVGFPYSDQGSTGGVIGLSDSMPLWFFTSKGSVAAPQGFVASDAVLFTTAVDYSHAIADLQQMHRRNQNKTPSKNQGQSSPTVDRSTFNFGVTANPRYKDSSKRSGNLNDSDSELSVSNTLII